MSMAIKTIMADCYFMPLFARLYECPGRANALPPVLAVAVALAKC